MIFFALIFTSFIFGQNTTSPTVNGQGRKSPDELIPAKFPEGNKVFATLLSSKFTVTNIDCSVTGIQKTLIEFVVEKDGSINAIKTFGSNESLNKEAVRTIKSIVQKWTPATLNGENVRSKYTQPFSLVCQ